jgi:hypothetical protein
MTKGTTNMESNFERFERLVKWLTNAGYKVEISDEKPELPYDDYDIAMPWHVSAGDPVTFLRGYFSGLLEGRYPNLDPEETFKTQAHYFMRKSKAKIVFHPTMTEIDPSDIIYVSARFVRAD